MSRAVLISIFAATVAISAACFFPDLSALEGATPDSGAPRDGSLTDAAAVDGGPGFCATLTPPPTFCDDFDDASVNVAFPEWTDTKLTYNSTIVRDPTLVRSPPLAMLATVYPQKGTQDYPASFVQEALASGSRVELSTAMYIEKVDPASNGATLLMVQLGSIDLRLNLQTTVTNMTIVDVNNLADGGQQYTTIGSPFSLVSNQWMRVSFIVDMVMSTVEVKLDTGAGAVDVLPPTKANQTLAPSKAKVDVGLWYVHSTTVGWAVHYDNVAMTVTP